MNFKSRKDYQEHVKWCTGEMELWLNNDEKLYTRFRKIMDNPKTSERGKISRLRDNFGEFHNGTQQIGRYTRFTDIVKEELASMELDKS